MTGKRRWLIFIAGMLTGIGLLTALGLTTAFVGGQQTWLLRINTNGISEKIEGSAKVMIVEMLPEYIEGLKDRIPDLITERVSSQFGEVHFQLGGELFTLPQEFVDRLENNYNTCLTNSINELLSNLPLEEMGDDLGSEIASIVENSLYAEFNSRTIGVDLIEGAVTVPVFIELINQPGAKDFQLCLYSPEPREEE
jgi:hypothetical protein